jgi:hypothetical protein
MYADMKYDHVIDFDVSSTALMIYLTKAALFVWMRYVEENPSSELVNYQTHWFYTMCDQLSLHRRPDNHHLRKYMIGVKS